MAYAAHLYLSTYLKNVLLATLNFFFKLNLNLNPKGATFPKITKIWDKKFVRPWWVNLSLPPGRLRWRPTPLTTILSPSSEPQDWCQPPDEHREPLHRTLRKPANLRTHHSCLVPHPPSEATGARLTVHTSFSHSPFSDNATFPLIRGRQSESCSCPALPSKQDRDSLGPRSQEGTYIPPALAPEYYHHCNFSYLLWFFIMT